MSGPDLSHARVLRIAFPIVLSNATVPLLGLVNTGVIGQLGSAAPIGAVGLGAVVLTSVYWLFSFLRMGTTGIVAQAFGRGDAAEVSAGLWRALIVALAAGAVLIAAQAGIAAAAFRLAPASPEVESLARAYLGIRIWGAPATIGLFALNGWLIALERTRAILALQLVTNGLNIVLDIGFVLGLGLGVEGVATATLIAEWSGLGFGLWLARGAFTARPALAVILRRDKLTRMVSVNRDIMIRSVLLQGCFTAFLFLGSGEGDVTLAANQVLLQFLEITAYVLDGFAFAAETLVGQAVGAGQPLRLRRAAGVCGTWALGGAVALSLAFWLGGSMLIDALSTDPAVRAEARIYLPWLALSPLIGVGGWMFDGIFVGATLAREMRNTVIVTTLVYAAIVAALLPVWGNHALWAGLMAMNLMRGVVMAFLYPRAEARAATAAA